MVAARVFSLVSAAIQLPLLTRFLAPNEFALVAIAIAAATYFSLVSAEPTILSFQRFPGDDRDRGNYRFALKRVVICALILAFPVLLLSWSTQSLGMGIAVIGWGCGIIVNRFVSTAWLMWRRPWRYSCNLMITTGTRTAVLVLLVAYGTSVTTAVAIAGFASGLSAFVIAPLSGRSRTRADTPWGWPLGIHLALASLAFTLLANGSLLIAPLLVDADDVGRFAATTQVITYSSAAVSGLILTALYPELRRQWDSGAEAHVRSTMTVVVLLFIAIACGAGFVLAWGDYWGLSLIIGTDFGLGSAVGTIAISTAMGSAGMIASWERQFKLQVQQVNYRAWSAVVIGAATTLACSLMWGVAGVVVGYAFGYLTYFLLQSSGTNISLIARFSFSLLLGAAATHTIVPGIFGGWVLPVILASAAVISAAAAGWRVLNRNRTTALVSIAAKRPHDELK